MNSSKALKRKTRAVILAAGRGTRMKTRTPKLLIEIEGKPIIRRVVEACSFPEIEKIYVVVGHEAELIKKAAGGNCTFLVQREQLGTAHALMQTRSVLKNYRGDLVVVVGDSPFLTRQLVRRLISTLQRSGVAAAFLTTTYRQPPRYARVVRDKSGRVVNVVEEFRCTPAQKRITEVFTSHYCLRAEIALPFLKQIKSDNPKREYYLTDLIPILIRNGYKVKAVRVRNPLLVFGINDIRDLQWALRNST